jgi:hypothetical protein
VHHSDAVRVAAIEKANRFDIHEIQLPQIQSYSWTATLNLGFHLLKVVNSEIPAQSNTRCAFSKGSFNLQRHVASTSEAQSTSAMTAPMAVP